MKSIKTIINVDLNIKILYLHKKDDHREAD